MNTKAESFLSWRTRARATFLTVAMLAFGFSSAPIYAQSSFDASLFSAVATVNGLPVTAYEVAQRGRFLQLLNLPGSSQDEVIKELIADRLTAQQARRFNVRLTDARVEAGMAEFAGRANISVDEFVRELSANGVSRETFVDFVRNGLLWRELVNAKFAANARVSEVEIDREIANIAAQRDLRFKISEILIPIDQNTQNIREVEGFLENLIKALSKDITFSEAAKLYSGSPSAPQGGSLDWISASKLPPKIVHLLLTTNRGKPTPPVLIGTAMGIFQLNDVSIDTKAQSPQIALDYISYPVPQDNARAASLRSSAAQAENCQDFIGIWGKSSPTSAEPKIISRDLNKTPRGVARSLAQLDAGEHTFVRFNGAEHMLMLCARSQKTDDQTVTRAAIRDQIFADKLTRLAKLWQEELRADAIIDYAK